MNSKGMLNKKLKKVEKVYNVKEPFFIIGKEKY
jgi:hypothetical protein